MAAALADLTSQLGVTPEVVVGHSAGAAILARMCLDGRLAPTLLVALNGALKPFPGLASILFPSMARMLFLNRDDPEDLRLDARTARRCSG